MSIRKYSMALALAALTFACSSGETLRTGANTTDTSVYDTGSQPDAAADVATVDLGAIDTTIFSDANDADGGADVVAPQACISDKVCTKPYVCNTTRKVCVRCVADADCGVADQHCHHSVCEQVTLCTKNDDCATVSGKPMCALAAGECGCSVDGDCPPSNICVKGACVERAKCDSSNECTGAGALVCDKTRHICVDCVGVNDCNAGTSGQTCTALNWCRSVCKVDTD